MVVMLHSNGQLMTDSGSDTEKAGQKPALQQKTTDNITNNNLSKAKNLTFNL